MTSRTERIDPFEDDSRGIHYRNVDLDIRSTKMDLQPLVSALGKKVIVLDVQRFKRTYYARLEPYWTAKDPNAAIRGFCKLIASLPHAEREAWDTAKIREFDIGIQARNHPCSVNFALTAETVKAAAELGARISVTVYASEDSPCWEGRIDPGTLDTDE
jgi:hypothetical protein